MPSDASKFIARKIPRSSYQVTTRFSRRLRSHDRPVTKNPELLPEDSPGEQFITKPQ